MHLNRYARNFFYGIFTEQPSVRGGATGHYHNPVNVFELVGNTLQPAELHNTVFWLYASECRGANRLGRFIDFF